MVSGLLTDERHWPRCGPTHAHPIQEATRYAQGHRHDDRSLLARWRHRPALAQQTTGNITGRIVDEQGAAVPGVTVTAKNPQPALLEPNVSDAEGVYRLSALPVGIYDVTAELQGFATVERRRSSVNIGQTIRSIPLKVARPSPRRSTSPARRRSSRRPLVSVGGVVDVQRIESLPLNGRQFANLAATVPGVGLGFHCDPTKSTQYAPQINGGAGRNVNYQIDGGDNNDDTVGGLLQQFPLEAIEEFNFVTQRFKAEYGRSNGGVHERRHQERHQPSSGSFFEFFRDKSMNAHDRNREAGGRHRPTSRTTAAISSAAASAARSSKDKAHFFFRRWNARSRTPRRPSTRRGCSSDLDGSTRRRTAKILVTGKATANLTPNQYLSVRYGRNTNSSALRRQSDATPDNWGDSANTFNSFNVNHNWVLGGAKLNEFIFQYADFANTIAARTSASEAVVSQWRRDRRQYRTRRRRPNRRSTSSATTSPGIVTGRGGLGHDFKVGVNFINEPRLFITFNGGKGVVFNTHLTNDLNGPISTVTVSDGNSSPTSRRSSSPATSRTTGAPRTG